MGGAGTGAGHGYEVYAITADGARYRLAVEVVAVEGGEVGRATLRVVLAGGGEPGVAVEVVAVEVVTVAQPPGAEPG